MSEPKERSSLEELSTDELRRLFKSLVDAIMTRVVAEITILGDYQSTSKAKEILDILNVDPADDNALSSLVVRCYTLSDENLIALMSKMAYAISEDLGERSRGLFKIWAVVKERMSRMEGHQWTG